MLNVGTEFEKREGVTVKDRMFQRLQSANSHITLADLEAYYGLEISLCTGAARRVPLRYLLANALPSYVESTIPGPPHDWDTFGQSLVNALRGPHFAVWFKKQTQEHKISVTTVIGSLLNHLRSTGLDSDENLNVAWIYPDQVHLCFKLRCDDVNAWAKILADTDHCATFACVTTDCFETDTLKCQGGSLHQWRNVSELLSTEICRHANLAPINIGVRQEFFALKENAKYWIGPMNAGLVASVVNLTASPTLEISQDWLRKIPERYRERAILFQRAKRERLRERGAAIAQTVMVTVRAHRT